jgi:hypothetical protein
MRQSGLARCRLKMAVFAPMPITSTAAEVKPGFFWKHTDREAKVVQLFWHTSQDRAKLAVCQWGSGRIVWATRRLEKQRESLAEVLIAPRTRRAFTARSFSVMTNGLPPINRFAIPHSGR